MIAKCLYQNLIVTNKPKQQFHTNYPTPTWIKRATFYVVRFFILIDGLDMENLQNWVRSIMALLLGLWASLPELTHLLIWLMIADTALGLTIAVRQRELSAAAAWNGATKKLGSLLMVGVAALLNPHIQDFIEINLVQVASAFYIVPELTSIIRNAAILDIPVFVQMQPILRYFQAASGTDTEAKSNGK